jgi:hypothetical protein
MITRVRCYAGTSYPERPVAFEWEGRWLDVARAIAQSRTPEGMVFDVLAADGQRYRLNWVEACDRWSVNHRVNPGAFHD